MKSQISTTKKQEIIKKHLLKLLNNGTRSHPSEQVIDDINVGIENRRN